MRRRFIASVIAFVMVFTLFSPTMVFAGENSIGAQIVIGGGAGDYDLTVELEIAELEGDDDTAAEDTVLVDDDEDNVVVEDEVIDADNEDVVVADPDYGYDDEDVVVADPDYGYDDEDVVVADPDYGYDDEDEVVADPDYGFEDEVLADAGFGVSEMPVFATPVPGIAIMPFVSGSGSIVVTDRGANWQGLDILDSAIGFQVDDVVVVTGRIRTTPVSTGWVGRMMLNSRPGGWFEAHHDGASNMGVNNAFTMTVTIVDAPTAAELGFAYVDDLTIGNPAGFRIQTNGDDVTTQGEFYIDGITVTRNTALIFDLETYLADPTVTSLNDIPALQAAGATAVIERPTGAAPDPVQFDLRTDNVIQNLGEDAALSGQPRLTSNSATVNVRLYNTLRFLHVHSRTGTWGGVQIMPVAGTAFQEADYITVRGRAINHPAGTQMTLNVLGTYAQIANAVPDAEGLFTLQVSLAATQVSDVGYRIQTNNDAGVDTEFFIYDIIVGQAAPTLVNVIPPPPVCDLLDDSEAQSLLDDAEGTVLDALETFEANILAWNTTVSELTDWISIEILGSIAEFDIISFSYDLARVNLANNQTTIEGEIVLTIAAEEISGATADMSVTIPVSFDAMDIPDDPAEILDAAVDAVRDLLLTITTVTSETTAEDLLDYINDLLYAFPGATAEIVAWDVIQEAEVGVAGAVEVTIRISIPDGTLILAATGDIDGVYESITPLAGMLTEYVTETIAIPALSIAWPTEGMIWELAQYLDDATVADLDDIPALSIPGGGHAVDVAGTAPNRHLALTGRTAPAHGVDLLHAEIDFEAGDIVTVTGRLGSNIPAGWGAMILNTAPGGWSESFQSGDVRNIGANGDFTLELILTAAHITSITGANPAGIRIQSNNADEMDFFIDNITVYRPAAQTVTVIRYSLYEDAYVQGLSAPTTNNLAGAANLDLNGVTTVNVRSYSGTNYLHVVDRAAGSHGVEVVTDGLAVEVGDVVRVTGRLGADVPTGWFVMHFNFVNDASGWNERASTGGLSANEVFTLEHTLSAADVAILNAAGGAIRVGSNHNNDANLPIMDFFIHTIYIGRLLPAVTFEPPPPATIGVGDAVYSLAAHEEVQNMATGDTFENAAPLQRAGSPTFEIIPHPTSGGNSILVTDRANNWDGLDINFGPAGMQPYNTYEITVTGRIEYAPADSQIMLQGMDGHSWQGNHGVATGDTFTLFFEITPDHQSDWHAFRVVGNNEGATMIFIIDDIEIVLTEIGEPPDDNGNGGVGTEVWRLSTDTAVQAIPMGTVMTPSEFDNASGAHLTESGNPTFTIVESPDGTNAIRLSDRTENWFTIDVRFAPLNIAPGGEYRFTASGRVEGSPAGVNVQWNQDQAPWSALAGTNTPVAADGTWEIVGTLQGQNLETWLQGDQTAMRIQTTGANGPTAIFIVDEIIVEVLGEPEIEFNLLHHITFTPEQYAEYRDWFTNTATHGDSMSEYTWAFTPVGGGQDDNYVMRGHHIGTELMGEDPEGDNRFTAQRNALRLTFPEPLPPGYSYEISIWYYIPLNDNAGLNPGFGNDRKTGTYDPGFLVNGQAGNAAYTFRSLVDMPFDEWVELRVTILYDASYIETIDIRFHGNSPLRFPDVWYFDNIRIYRGEAASIVAPEWDLALPSLAETFQPWFMFGNIYPGTTSAVIDQFGTREAYIHHFNAITAENHHKPDQIAGPGARITVPTVDEFNFAQADAVVDWAVANDITLVGHAFVWHSQSPNWLFLEAPGEPHTREQARANMEFYIRTLSEHWAARGLLGAFYSWDVANEVIASGGGTWTGDWRDQIRATGNPWLDAYANATLQPGEHATDYIYDAFVFARRYFPYSILYYNDYNEEIPAKRDAIAAMVEYFNERWAHDTENNPEAVPTGSAYNGRLLIEAIGMQSHYHLHGWTTNIDNVRPAIQRFVDTGARVSITELDITIGGFGGPAPDEADIPALLEHQAEVYGRLFGYYLEFAEHIGRVSIWGLADHQSWRAAGRPLLFDARFEAKPAFYAILDAAAAATLPTVQAATIVTGSSLPNGEVSNHYITQLVANRNNNSPVLWSVVGGSLPPGMVLHSRTGVVEGTPTQEGTFTFTVEVSNLGGSNTSQFTIVIGDNDDDDDQGDNNNQGDNNQGGAFRPGTGLGGGGTTTVRVGQGTYRGRQLSRIRTERETRLAVAVTVSQFVSTTVSVTHIQNVINATPAGEQPVVVFNLARNYHGVTFHSRDITTLINTNSILIIQSGLFVVGFGAADLQQWNLGANDTVTIVVRLIEEDLTGLDPVNLLLLSQLIEVYIMVNGEVANNIQLNAVVVKELAALLGLDFADLEGFLYAVLFGEGFESTIEGAFDEYGNFVFFIDGAGMFGVVFVEAEVPVVPTVQPMVMMQTQLNFAVGSTSFMLNGVSMVSDGGPVFMDANNNLMVPVRVMAEAFGANVSWEEATRTIIFVHGGQTNRVPVSQQLPEGTLVIVNNRAFAPIQLLADLLGVNLDIDGTNVTVTE